MSSEVCKVCQFRFEAPEPVEFAGRKFGMTTCPSCRQASIDETAAKDAAVKRQRAVEAWGRQCPALFQATDPARLNQKMLAKVMAWQFGPKGLLVSGPSDRGKTRAMFLLLRRLAVDELRDVVVFHDNEFAHQCARAFGDQTGEAWVEKICKASVVFFDDIGKFKLTERVESELFGIVASRTAWMRPTLWTTNFKGEELASKLSPDRGVPLVRRLKEFCEGIEV